MNLDLVELTSDEAYNLEGKINKIKIEIKTEKLENLFESSFLKEKIKKEKIKAFYISSIIIGEKEINVNLWLYPASKELNKILERKKENKIYFLL